MVLWIVKALLFVPTLILRLFGFGKMGVVVGWPAAFIQGVIAPVVKGSFFALCQAFAALFGLL